MFKILLAEDDVNLRNLLIEYLESIGFKVQPAINGLAAYKLFVSSHFDMLITDIMMPEMDGNELVRKIKSKHPDFPIIVLTALDTITDKEKSYENGADDYLTKPLNFVELKLRINAVLRRYDVINEKILVHKGTRLDYNRFSLTVSKKEIELTKKEFLLLYRLFSAPGRIFTREQLLNEIWGYDTYSIDRTVDVHINKIRGKLDPREVEIISVRGLGYKAVLK